MRNVQLIVSFTILCGVVAACRENSAVNNSLSELPDPITIRLGAEKARSLQIAGVKRHITDVRTAFGGYADVNGQCDAAEALVCNADVMMRQRPMVLCAGSLDTDPPQLLLSGLNPHRETVCIAFHYSINGTTWKMLCERQLSVKDEEITLALPRIYIRYTSIDEIQQLLNESPAMGQKTNTLSITIDDNHRDITLPMDIPVFVSIYDRNGLRSDAQSFHRSLVIGDRKKEVTDNR